MITPNEGKLIADAVSALHLDVGDISNIQDRTLEWASRLSEGTAIVPVVSPGCLELLPSGKTSFHRRYNWQSLRQVCGVLCRGLYLTIEDLSWAVGVPERFQVDDQKTAITLFNSVLRRRFFRLSGYGMVVDRPTNSIGAVTSNRYARLAILDGLVEVADAIRFIHGRNFLLKESHLEGRSCLGVYCFHDSVEVQNGQRSVTTHTGIAVFMSEIPGVSIRFHPALVEENSGMVGVGRSPASSRVAHFSRKAFKTKLREAVQATLARLPDRSQLENQTYRLARRQIVFGTTNKEIAASRNLLKANLVSCGASASLANEVSARLTTGVLETSAYGATENGPAEDLYVLLSTARECSKTLLIDDRFPVYRFIWEQFLGDGEGSG